jgi:4-hydroxybenzoate polyprenyltransferase
VTARRPRWRAYLLLARVSNLPTLWTNVLAGLAAAGTLGGGRPAAELVWLGAAASLSYMGGMFLNDAFDRKADARSRPDRPIPAGDARAEEVFAAGFALLAAGWVLPVGWALASGRRAWGAAAWGAALAATILYYDWRHKRDPLAPFAMAACRGLVYCVAAAAAAGAVAARVGLAASVLAAYVALITFVARAAGRRAGWAIAALIAAISLVDAGILAWFGPAPLAAAGVAGFVLTLLLQRWVPGT